MHVQEFHQKLMNLMTDDRFKNLITTQNFENYYNRNGIDEAQNIFTLLWLLNPKGSHGLGDMFTKEFIYSAWSTIHNMRGNQASFFKDQAFYKQFNPLMMRKNNFEQVTIDRYESENLKAVNFTLTDIENKILIIVNNNYDAKNCEEAYQYFCSSTYDYFTSKIFVSFDGVTASSADSKWTYLNNTWIINLVSQIMETPYHNGERYYGQLKEFYHFLTGTPYGMGHTYFAETIASLVNDYYETFLFLKNYRTDHQFNRPLVDITPIDYVTQYSDKIGGTDLDLLQTYWAYKAAFQTFFQVTEYETVTRNVSHYVESKNYMVNKQYVRNGLSFTPCFYGDHQTFLNQVFTVEAVWDMNNRLTLDLIVNKKYWDRVPKFYKNILQERLNLNGEVLTDRFVITTNYYHENWTKKDIGQDIISFCDKIDHALENLKFKVA